MEELDLSQPLVSHHLRELKRTLLVEVERKGPFVYYWVNRPEVVEVLRQLGSLASSLGYACFWDQTSYADLLRLVVMDWGQRPVLLFQIHLAINCFPWLQVIRVGGVDDKHGDLDTLLNPSHLAHDHFRNLELATGRDLKEKERPTDPQLFKSWERLLHPA